MTKKTVVALNVDYDDLVVDYILPSLLPRPKHDVDWMLINDERSFDGINCCRLDYCLSLYYVVVDVFVVDDDDAVVVAVVAHCILV